MTYFHDVRTALKRGGFNLVENNKIPTTLPIADVRFGGYTYEDNSAVQQVQVSVIGGYTPDFDASPQMVEYVDKARKILEPLAGGYVRSVSELETEGIVEGVPQVYWSCVIELEGYC